MAIIINDIKGRMPQWKEERKKNPGKTSRELEKGSERDFAWQALIFSRKAPNVNLPSQGCRPFRNTLLPIPKCLQLVRFYFLSCLPNQLHSSRQGEDFTRFCVSKTYNFLGLEFAESLRLHTA